MKLIMVSCIIMMVVVLGMRGIEKWDAPLSLNRRQQKWILGGILAEAAVISCLPGIANAYVCLLLGIFAGCLLLACITDAFLCQVHCFVWWIALPAGVALLVAKLREMRMARDIVIVLLGLLLFGFLQYSLFGRTYGRADSHAFFACALVETALGAGLEVYFLHMTVAYILMIIVQIGKKNITKRGMLKYPVPFLPYINLSFWLVIVVLA